MFSKGGIDGSIMCMNMCMEGTSDNDASIAEWLNVIEEKRRKFYNISSRMSD